MSEAKGMIIKMIEKINITNYGSFKNFSWEDIVDNKFSHRNIIYGRNYSGKTTLSRIFRSIEKQKHHEDFTNINFDLILADGQAISESQIDQSNLYIRVFNSDFKRDNLSVFYDKDGEVQPFTILGEKNIEIEIKINEARTVIENYREQLGSENEKIGKIGELKKLEIKQKRLERNLNKKLSGKAGNIFRNKNFFLWSEHKKRYNITDLKNEIKEAKILTVEERQKYKDILNDDIKSIIEYDLNDIDEISLNDILNWAEKLLIREIKPSKTIEDLLNDNELQNWVYKGRELHKGKRDTCAFCNNNIKDNLWESLDAHFTKESEQFQSDIQVLLNQVNTHLESWKAVDFDAKEDFYTRFHSNYDDIHNKWKELKKKQIENYLYIKGQLEKRSASIFSNIRINREYMEDVSEVLKESIDIYKELILTNNRYSNNLTSEQDNARKHLRLDQISIFLKDIDYENRLEEIKKMEEKKDLKAEEKETLQKDINSLLIRIAEWESEINDEERAVIQINKYLRGFLGHPELSLVVENDNMQEKEIKFNIERNGEPAYNLSEGEQSLIAFCYFLANLKSISNPEDYIIFIDDPISSLDTNNLFYIFSLIDSEIASVNYNQVFISTHNLELLRYLHRINRPTGNGKWKKRFFMIEREFSVDNTVMSKIIKMPKYLKKYTTEFTYLFEQIYRVATEKQNENNYHVFYSFGNNARKFLESYLFFKYPDHSMNGDRKLEKFFGTDMQSVSFINRINNELSHAENQVDRIQKPVDIPELKQDANLILFTIRRHDNEQFKSLCSSIGADYSELMDKHQKVYVSDSKERKTLEEISIN